MEEHIPDNFSIMDHRERVFWKKIGRQIANARKKNGPMRIGYDRRRRKITQTVLAEHLGLSRPSVANIETGRQRVDVYTFTRIMDFLEEMSE